MAKLYFRYSAMDAGKTLDLLKVAYNYKDKGQHTLIITSDIDKRSGENKVKSRIGLDNTALSTNINTNIFDLIKQENNKTKIACILVDEINFFSVKQVDGLADVVDYLNIPVICYGLRTDYRGETFPSSGRLLAIADTIEELKTICHCGAKATYNMLIRNNIAIKEGECIIIDNENLKCSDARYMSVCRLHWKEGRFFS